MSNQGNPGNTPVHVTVNVSGPPPIIVRRQPGCLIQFLYFFFIGWWLGALAISLAYFLFVTVIGIPLGIMIINKVPYLMALRETDQVISYAGTVVEQHNFVLRALWFLLVGIWLTALWLSLAYFLACTIIAMPIGFWMFDKAPALLTLRRS